MPSPMKVGTTVMMNSSIASSSRKDPMISPPPIIQTFLPACVRRRSAKARDRFGHEVDASGQRKQAAAAERTRSARHLPLKRAPSSRLRSKVLRPRILASMERSNSGRP